MKRSLFASAVDILSEEFARRDWKYLDVPPGDPREKTYAWPSDPQEEIMICVHKGPDIQEKFHRQDFFFFNFAYCGDYGAPSYRYNNHITIHEGECYIGQPHAGYALYAHGKKDIIIVGVLIQKETFFRTFLPVLSSDSKLFHFFLAPQTNQYSDEFIHLRFENDTQVRTLLEMMVVEYASKQEDTQTILRPLTLTLFMQVARQYRRSTPTPESESLPEKIVRYISEHPDTVTLKDIAEQFSYHPSYISALLHRELGKTFSELLTEQRMDRAVALLKGTNLPIEEIAVMLGYCNSSNFYKAFRTYYGKTPREYISEKM